jgi:hypothetical protein
MHESTGFISQFELLQPGVEWRVMQQAALSNTRRNVLPFLTFCPTANVGLQHMVRGHRLCLWHLLRLERVDVKG